MPAATIEDQLAFRQRPAIGVALTFVAPLPVVHGAFFLLQWLAMGESFQYAVAITVRFMLQTAVWMLFYALARPRLDRTWMVASLITAGITVVFSVFELAYQVLAEGWLGMPRRPQDGIIIFAGCLLLWFAAKRIRQKLSSHAPHFEGTREQSVLAALLATVVAFWIFIHFVLITVTWYGVDERRLEHHRTIVSIPDGNIFLELCDAQFYRKPAGWPESNPWAPWVCYSGPADEDLPAELAAYAGFEGIHHDSGNSEVRHIWLTSIAGLESIENPLKVAAYARDETGVRALIDMNFWMDTRQVFPSTMRLFQMMFIIVWVYGGLILLKFHEHRFLQRIG